MVRIRASKCEISEIEDISIIQKFLEENHRQGYANFSKAIGLYYNEELVQVMTFGNPRFTDKYHCEIIRDCSKKNYLINGGTSKIWRYFIEHNNIRSCIVYSYPHDEHSLFTNKYIDYCGFRNIKRAKPEKKIYFEGIWKGELKRIDKSLLERQGADRLLNDHFGHDRTNEQILLDLGFEKKCEEGYSPQVDSYFPFGVLYRIDDLTDGTFYIGKCESKKNWENGYMGSGLKWRNHLRSYPENGNNAHSYKRTILRGDFNTPGDLYKVEINEIRKYSKEVDGKWIIDNESCMNVIAYEYAAFNRMSMKSNPCPECGAKRGHKKSCSKYKQPMECPECGAKYNHHRPTCSKYNAKICPECGGKGGHHLKKCTHFKQVEICSECGSPITNHKSNCSHNTRDKKVCPECGSIGVTHKKTCSHYVEPKSCPECGKKFGHKKSCSHYTEPKGCPECGGITAHYKTCSHYKDSTEKCPECGGKRGHHKSSCSKYKDTPPCPECGKKFGHKKSCSQYKEQKGCPECGSTATHKKTCSHYTPPKPCEECGNLKGHKKTCSHYTLKETECPECGGKRGHHKSSCSKYKEPEKCPECGSVTSHKKTCSKFIKRDPCPECGNINGHKKTYSRNKNNINS